MWHGCLQAVRSTQTDRRVTKHTRRTWSVSAATRSRLKVLTDQDEVGWQQQIERCSSDTPESCHDGSSALSSIP